jgi:polysaccharide pyruvyl transferase WcaK-like protein
MSANEKLQSPSEETIESEEAARGAICRPDDVRGQEGPRIALLTPYTGGNLGDAAIQDAVIGNLRLRVPSVQFSGISLNCENFAERHGGNGFPLCGTNRKFYGMSSGGVTSKGADAAGTPGSDGARPHPICRAFQRFLGRWRTFRRVRSWATTLPREIRHSIQAYRFLRTQDLLIVSGGGQLDEEWGGVWGHPYALFKWAVLSRLARVPYAVVSVGACKVTSTVSRLFFSAALRRATYRSYRDKNSREIATSLLERSIADPIVPDPAFGVPLSDLPRSTDIRAISQGRTVVAISPIAYAKPNNWPQQDHALYDRYLRQMARVVSQLLDREYFLIIVCSSLGDDESVIPELLGLLDANSKKRLLQQVYIPTISTWKDLTAALRKVDFLIASRLHSVILGFATHTPTVAISFAPKVDWVMAELGQTDCLLQICDFTAEDVIHALEAVELRRNIINNQLIAYQDRVLSISARQYDVLIDLATANG